MEKPTGHGGKPRFVVNAVEIADLSLEGTAEALEAVLDMMIRDNPLMTIQVLPMRVAYSAPSDNMMRDYHYVETGFILVGANPPRVIDKPSR